MCRSSWVIGCLVALAAPSRAAPLLDLSRPLPSSSALPSLHAEWTTPIAGLGPAGDAAHAQSILLARPIGRQGLVVALDASSGHAAWPRGRELDDRDGASAIVGDDIVFFDRSGDVAIARLSDGQRRFTIRGTRCERGRIAGSGKLALAFCYRSRGGLLRADSDAREEAEWLTIDLDAGQLRSRSPADAMAVGLQCGATLCVAELVGFSGRAKRRVEQRALDLVAGKALWSTREDGQLLAVRGQSVVLLYRRKIVIFDAQTGRMHWGVALRAWQSTSGMTISPAYVDDSSITIVQPSVIETHDLATGTTRGGVTLPQLPVDANVFVTRAGAKLLAFVSGGDLGDGYLLVYDGGHASLVAGFGSPQGVRIIDDRLFVARHLETLSSYSLSLDRLDPPKPRSDAPPAPAIEIEADARIRYAPEDLPPRRGRDAILADQVRTAPDPIATEALDALEKLRSPMLRAVAEDVLRKPWTAARRGLVDRAIDELMTLDGPVPFELLAPYLAPGAHVSPAAIAALLARGDAKALDALATLDGPPPKTWQTSCLATTEGAAHRDFMSAALQFIARFELGTTDRMLAPSDLSEPTLEPWPEGSGCRLNGQELTLVPRTQVNPRRRMITRAYDPLRLEELAFDGQSGSVRTAFAEGFHGYGIRLDLVKQGDVWRVVRRRYESEWDQ